MVSLTQSDTLVLRSCEYVTSHGKETSQMSIRILTVGNYPGLPGWSMVITKVLIGRRLEVRERKRDVASTEDGARSPKPRTVDGLQKLEKAREHILP